MEKNKKDKPRVRMHRKCRLWVDENLNTWDTDRYSREAADQSAKTLKDCYECSNCHDCVSCYRCSRCYKCSNCNNCIECSNSDHLDACLEVNDSVHCDNCRRASGLNNSNDKEQQFLALDFTEAVDLSGYPVIRFDLSKPSSNSRYVATIDSHGKFCSRGQTPPEQVEAILKACVEALYRLDEKTREEQRRRLRS